jgi:hypothetical protein
MLEFALENRVDELQGGGGMKTNGVVRRLMSRPPGIERWEAKCLLCPWRSGKRRLYASKNAAELGIGMHLSTIHKLNLKKRRVEERAPRAISPSLLSSGTRFTPEKSSE